MKPQKFIFRPGSVLAVVSLVVAFSFGCSAHARSTTVRTEKRSDSAGEYKADEFIGVPIVGDYDDNPDLDFILEVADGDRTFKIKVHEDAGDSNREVLEKLTLKINEAVDKSRMRVIGYYSSEYKGQEKEYGFMDLKTLVFYDEATGYEDAYFTDNKDSRFYDEGDVTIVYAPGHHYRSVYYPRYCTPWWDNDWDGIPDRYDPWPYSYDTWYDYNLNGFPDWYDPYYAGVYPYWDRWDFGFWVSYNWYSPSYFRFYRERPFIYYDDYRHYSRLYDHRVVTVNRRGDNRLTPNGSATLNVKAQNRNSGDRGRGTTAGTYSAADGVSRYGTLSTDRRRYVPSNEVAAATNTGQGETFTRNRNTETSTNYSPDSRSRNTTNTRRTYTAPQGKTKAEGAVNPAGPAESGRTVDRSRTTSRSGGDNRNYVPSNRARVVGGESGSVSGTSGAAPNSNSSGSRTRTVTTGRTTAPSEYTAPVARERSSNTNRYRGSYQTSRSGGYSAPSSSSGSSSGSSYDRGSSSGSRSRDSGSYTPSGNSRSSSGSVSQPSSSSRSRSSSPAPAATRSAPSSGGSRPAAAPSSSGSRSRDSGSSSGSSTRSSGSSGGDRRRK